MSLIRHVPYDIIREITFHSLPLHPSPNLHDVPVSVSQVCSAWRAVALSSPHLWTTLFLNISDKDKFAAYEMMVEEWFRRAKGLPLSLFIFFDIEPDDRDEEIDFRALVRSFAPFIPQVRHLGIGADWIGDILPLFLNMAPDWDFRHLEKLDLSSPGSEFYNQEPATIPPVVIFNQAPHLQTLTITNEFVTNHGVSTALPWSQLTQVYIDEGLLVETWIKIMVLSPQMQIGHFYIAQDEDEILLQEPMREHSHLEKLTLNVIDHYPHPLDLLKKFQLPNLHVLHLTYGHMNPMPTETLLPSLIGLHQLSLLRSLYLETRSYPAHYLIEFLRKAVNLEELELRCNRTYPPPPTLLHALTYTSLPTILPRLSSLTFSSFPYQSSTDTFFDMIKSRCVNVPTNFQPLKCLSMSRPVRLEAEELEIEARLRPCVEMGLFLEFVYNKPDSIFSVLDNWLDSIFP